MKKTKVLSGMLAGCMLMSALTGCGGGSSADSGSTPSASGGDAAATPTGTVRIMSNVTGGKDDAEMKLFSEALSKATGLTIEIEKPASDYNKVLMQKLQGGEEYDLIYCGANEYVQLIDQGALLDITDRVKNSEILSNNIDPQEWADITVDGKVYAGFNKKEVHRVVQLNRQMLEAAGIDYTKIEPTLDGYYKVFKALKENNTTKDFYPFNCVLSESYDLQPWFASAGLSNGVREVNGKKTCAYATEEAIPVWEWFKKLYDEGLLDPSSFVDQTKDMRAKMEASSLKTAVCVDWAAWLGLHNSNALAGATSWSRARRACSPYRPMQRTWTAQSRCLSILQRRRAASCCPSAWKETTTPRTAPPTPRPRPARRTATTTVLPFRFSRTLSIPSATTRA